MIDLAGLQQKLNSDPELRSQFLKDPVSFLQQAGLTLSQEQAQKLIASLTLLTTKQITPNAPCFILVQVDGQ
ncbi:MAG TPA: hypothetical protein VG488_05130 [Candidatus Angelobacter sp.]|nr:hypothetical protein [Candidatus Angelobacter sp.]